MISPKKRIVFDYYQHGNETRILIAGEDVKFDIAGALRHYENILIVKGEFDEQF